ncbi:MAG: transglutaminase-like domain-containing protein [Bryobacteraceae bacterium]
METRIAGQPAGYVHERSETAGDGRAIVTAESRTVINRLGSKVEIKGSTRTVEDATGSVISIHCELSSSAQTTAMDGNVANGVLTLKISTGGKDYQRSIPLTSPLTGPEGGRRLTVKALRNPGDQVSYPVFSAELGTLQTVSRTLVRVEDDVLVAEESLSGLPGKASLWLDRDGRTRRRTQESPFGTMESLRSERDGALAAVSGATLPAEAFERSVIRSNIRLPHERETERLRVRLTHRRPELGWPDFRSEYQSVVESSRESVVVDIRRPDHQREVAAANTTDLARYLEPNALFQADDAEVQRITREVAGGIADQFQRAVALRDWTSRNMRFDPGIAVVPASEVVRNRAGTCFGYSILLGSLARAAQIPSRMKIGFVYTGGIWAGHAWIEMLIGQQWLPFDAALTSRDVADAGRISFFTGSLEEGTIIGVGSLAQMFGNVEVAIDRYTVAGKEIVVSPGAAPFRIERDRYINPWLGLELEKPAAYRFTKTSPVWPDATVVAFEAPQKASVSLERFPRSAGKDAEIEIRKYLAKRGVSGTHRAWRVSNRRGFCVESAGGHKAALVLVTADDIWVLRAESRSALATLKLINKSLKLPE